jgi:adenosylcobinamide-GDP ribazoletransferase
VSGLVAAARYLTIVPLPGRPHGGGEELGAAAPWFPVVGLGIGVILVVTEQITVRLFPALIAALLTVTVWKLLTGGLHLDGLADCLDGLVGRDPEHRLAIMRDSRIGAFGALGLILFLLLEVAAVAELPQALRWRVLVAAPAIARAMPPLIARAFPAARPHGHGAGFRVGLRVRSAALALMIAAALAFLALGVVAAVALPAALVAALAVGRFMAGRLGGVTGDVLGASVEVAELAVLLTVSAWTHARL